MSLRGHILLLVLLATLMQSVVIGVYEVGRRDSEIDDAKHNLSSLAQYAADNLDDKARGTVQLLHGLSRAADLVTPDKAACSEFLAGVLAHYPHYTGLLTITPDGDLHCDSLRLGRKLKLSGREYFKQVIATKEPAFDVVVGGLTGIAVLQVAYPVLDAVGALKFVLLASLNLAEYAQHFAGASAYPDTRILIWDRSGTLMVRKPETPGASLLGKAFPDSALFRFASSSGAGAAAELPDLDGVSRVWALGVLRQRGSDARITLGVPEAVLNADANRRLRNSLFLLVAVSMSAFAGAFFIAERSIRRPAARIMRIAALVEGGDFGARIGTPRPRGELGDLMRVIDRTADAVQAQQAVIEARSSDLRRANRTLRVLSGINSLIVRAYDRAELFREACRIVVEEGGFPMAWVGIADRTSMKLVPLAFAGRDEALLTAIKRRMVEGPGPFVGNSVTALAISTKQAVVSNDLQNDARVVFGKQYAEAGIRSMVILPLIVENEVMGVLAMYADETDFFNAEELKHLMELAGDIAFAIDHINKQERLDYLTYYDVLTGLANRALLHERLEQNLANATAHGRKLALVLLDIERFKTINDTLGRPAGDALLKDVAARLSLFAADAGQLARIDADHFAFMVPEVKAEEAVAHLIEQRMQEVFGPPFLADDTELRVSARFGVAMFPADGGDADTLLKNAEAALKNAKAGGDRYLFYTQSMNARIADKLSLENRLRQAIDHEEFVLHYQPRVNLASGKVTGAEALIRWNDPRTGLVPPGEFIPVLEETGLIYDVGRWALRKAIADYLRWLGAGLPAVRISVNVSSLQLRNRGFVAEIAQVIAATPHAAGGLELAITESLIMEDVMHNIASLRAIRAMGVSISLDDFGTGFSSLSHLSKLPVDGLKIDHSFVVDMTAGPKGLALVSTIIKLAHSLKLKVVAEGVETEEQSRLLHLLNCDEMQGYLLSKPMPAQIFESKCLARAPAVAER
ncbi:MAG: hypothetical protein JWN94_520 [Betaproteobacteria bacterium]|nr:hypothetical protein [Betaproteobacteria bacterium]